MEQRHQQRKIGGCLGLSNRGVVSEDRISELPEALLVDILSSLPTETAIATSVLSKNWRSLWKLLPKLKFDSDNHPRHTFSEDVCRSLISHKAPVLESLRLVTEKNCDASDVGIWIGIAFARHVRELVLSFEFQKEGSVRFPSVLCTYNDTLEILKLEYKQRRVVESSFAHAR
ncbi:PREDICTED: FBD-associated F-box protein At3g49020-like [Camelina sativa]|uniref:FBD-associated F-box protein At3g49020-like n=1 Tax=Camelina sativa TaxID=90675 RepID=A0ABM1RS97_CAMSA|nr:PREDICTED: FBD-associated F-box protein At3g49020-like [Camelina sativa]